jgi:flagellar biogenesis protein FliO
MRTAMWIIVLVVLSALPAGASAQYAPAGQQVENSTDSSLPALKPHDPANRPGPGKNGDGLPSTTTVIGSLLLVIGVFCALVWVLRKASPQGAQLLPAEAFEVLGRAHLGNRQHAHLLRCGNKLLLVSVSASGVEPLAEITDAAEVDRLTALCRQSRPNVAATAFRQVFRQKGKDNG